MTTNKYPKEPMFKSATDFSRYMSRYRKYPFPWLDNIFGYFENKYYEYEWLRTGNEIVWISKTTISKHENNITENNEVCNIFKAMVRGDGKIISDVNSSTLDINCNGYTYFAYQMGNQLKGIDIDGIYYYK